MIRLIILEKLAKVVIVALAVIALLVLDRTGLLAQWTAAAQRDLLLGNDVGLIDRTIDRVLAYVGHFSHLTSLAIALMGYGLLEGTEGVGLAMRRRWPEYLTVLATGFFIPYEVFEVLRGTSLLKLGALFVNVAIVVYLAWRKRLFIDV